MSNRWVPIFKISGFIEKKPEILWLLSILCRIWVKYQRLQASKSCLHVLPYVHMRKNCVPIWMFCLEHKSANSSLFSFSFLVHLFPRHIFVTERIVSCVQKLLLAPLYTAQSKNIFSKYFVVEWCNGSKSCSCP